MHNMDIWFKLMKHDPFIFNYVPDIAINSSYYGIYKDMLKKLPKLSLDILKGKNTLKGFSYEKIKEKNL